MSSRMVPVLICSLLLWGCDQFTSASAPTPDAEDKILARVNDAPIYQSDIEAAYAQLGADFRQLPLEVLQDALLEQLINRKMAVQAAKAEAYSESWALHRRIEGYRDRMIQEAYLNDLLEGRMTEERLRQHYEKVIVNAAAEEEVSARHILVADEAEARGLLDQLKSGGDFAALAKEKSLDTASGVTGGDLGYFQRELMVAPFSEAVFAADIGVLSDPVETQFGWHVIEVLDRRAAEKPSFEEATPRLRAELAPQLYEELLEMWTAAAKIEHYNEEGVEGAAASGETSVEVEQAPVLESDSTDTGSEGSTDVIPPALPAAEE